MPYGNHDPAKGEKPFVVGCGAFGGRSKKTGQPVGERHRWPNGWGQGRCEYCGRYLEEVMSKPKPRERTLEDIVHDAR